MDQTFRSDHDNVSQVAAGPDDLGSSSVESSHFPSDSGLGWVDNKEPTPLSLVISLVCLFQWPY